MEVQRSTFKAHAKTKRGIRGTSIRLGITLGTILFLKPPTECNSFLLMPENPLSSGCAS
jgi:hypothetical protein